MRFGDPETEALMLLLSEDTDLAAVILVRALKLGSSFVNALEPCRPASNIDWTPWR